jgi:hypothetical protein
MKTRFIGWLIVSLVIPTVLLAQPAEKNTIVGVWEVKMAPVGQAQSALLSLAMYGGDGSFTTLGGYKALARIPAVQEVGTEASTGYGRWAATGGRELRLTFYAIMWKEGLGNGYQRVQETLVLSEPGDEYTGHAQVDFLDANWNVVFSTTSEVEGTRLETPTMLFAPTAEKKQLVGIWEVQMSPVGQSQPPELSLAMYGADGSFTTGGSYKALPSAPAVQDVANELGTGYGRWAATNDKEVRLTFYSVMWKAGLMTGYQRVQETLVFSESGDEYTGRAQVDFLDASGKFAFSTSSEVKGTRLETPAMLLAQPAEEKQLRGVWAGRLKASGSERTRLTIGRYGADGSYTGSFDKRLPHGRMVGLRVGQSEATGNKEFQLILYEVRLNKKGVVDRFARVRITVTLSESGDELTVHSLWDVLDLNWTVVFRGTNDVKSTRLETPDQD